MVNVITRRIDPPDGYIVYDLVETTDVETLVQEALVAALAADPVGRELAYAERVAGFTTSNTDPDSTAAGSKIGTLTATVTGLGRPVVATLFLQNCFNSIPGTGYGAYLLINGIRGQLAVSVSSSAAFGPAISLESRVVLTEDVEYTFEVGIFGLAGDTTVGAAANSPMSLAVRGA